jgi:SH3-like domain-containing protein
MVVLLSYLLAAGGLCARILSRRENLARRATWLAGGATAVLVLMGATLLAREEVVAKTRWAIVLSGEVAVQSAPSAEDDLTLFHIHEGTKVRLDQVTEGWSEVVLEDGRVGWVPTGTFETI